MRNKTHKNGCSDSRVSIGYKDIYMTLWKCRDFELSTFWQRAVLLGSFMLVAYAGYGGLCVQALCKEFDSSRWACFHLLAIGIACFGLVASALWILMAKGSKGWIVRSEAALNNFPNEVPKSVFEKPNAKGLAAFGAHWRSGTFEEIEEANDSFLSCEWGHFSVSKVTICLGQLSLAGWCGLAFAHLLALSLGMEECKTLLQTHKVAFAIALIALCLTVVFGWLRKQTQSSSL